MNIRELEGGLVELVQNGVQELIEEGEVKSLGDFKGVVGVEFELLTDDQTGAALGDEFHLVTATVTLVEVLEEHLEGEDVLV